uniref:Ig-like domain-containing protein n=1 Tax=Capra hircus TaxID=9925 RepID=A0A452EYX0_CAPHI
MCPALLSFLSLSDKYELLSLSAWPSPVVPLGQGVTLQCHSRFRLFKTDRRRHLPKVQGDHFNNFTLGPVTREHVGSCMCSGADWSTPSDPLQILATSLLLGVFPKPAISAHAGPLVQVGENVALRCHSLVWFDNFTLHQENSTGLFQRCGQMLTGGYAAADFVIGPMTLASVGTYRWSVPSDPVDIVCPKPSLSWQGGPVVRSEENMTLVCSSESAFDQFHLLREWGNLGGPLAGGQGPRRALQAEFPLAHLGVYRCYDPLFLSGEEPLPGYNSSLCRESRLPQGHSSQLHLLLWFSGSFIYTSILLAPKCHWCSTHNHKSEGGKHTPKEDRTVNGEDPPAEDVIFVHLNHRTLSEGLFTPTPLSPMPLFTETSLYEEFDVNKEHADPDLAPSFEHTECYKLKSYVSF